MTPPLLRFRLIALLAMTSLGGCATTPALKPTAPPPPPPPPSEVHTEMAPIPNPTPQREEPRHVHAAPAEPSAQKTGPAPPPSTPAPPPHTPAPSNPLRAAQLRGAGLEQLNRGAINKAIALLKEAYELDPGNALIKHDLDRALRVDKALHEKR